MLLGVLVFTKGAPVLQGGYWFPAQYAVKDCVGLRTNQCSRRTHMYVLYRYLALHVKQEIRDVFIFDVNVITEL